MPRALQFALLLLLVALPARAQMVFSGGSMFSSDASGARSSAFVWDDLDGGFSNVYFFTNGPAAEVPGFS